MRQIQEPVFVQAFIAQASVERKRMGIYRIDPTYSGLPFLPR